MNSGQELFIYHNDVICVALMEIGFLLNLNGLGIKQPAAMNTHAYDTNSRDYSAIYSH